MLRYVVRHENKFWQESGRDEGIGVSGRFVDDRLLATKFTEAERDMYRASGSEALPVGYEWVVYQQRHKNAVLLQSAVNPAGIALSLHEAFCEVIREGGATRQQQEDPACRLILHHLAYLLGMTGGYDLTEYRKMLEHCEAEAKKWP